jgi:hypothetical protein
LFDIRFLFGFMLPNFQADHCLCCYPFFYIVYCIVCWSIYGFWLLLVPSNFSFSFSNFAIVLLSSAFWHCLCYKSLYSNNCYILKWMWFSMDTTKLWFRKHKLVGFKNTNNRTIHIHFPKQSWKTRAFNKFTTTLLMASIPWWTISPRGYHPHPPSSQCFGTAMIH